MPRPRTSEERARFFDLSRPPMLRLCAHLADDGWWLSITEFHGIVEGWSQIMSEEDLPQSVTFADGTPIPAEYVTQIQERGLACAVDVNWQVSDLLLIDNVLVGHGRRPFRRACWVCSAKRDCRTTPTTVTAAASRTT